MMMRIPELKLILIAVPLFAASLSACGGGNGPADATREWLDATVSLDGNRAASLTCDAMQESQMMGGAILSLAQMFSGSLFGVGADFDVSDLEYETVSEHGDEAIVHVNGTIRVAILGVSKGEDFDGRVRVVREDGKWKVCE